MNHSLVSIIIPCFNNEKFIGQAIESCILQNYREKEIIIVNDGSTDSSSQVIDSYKDKIHIITQQNTGGSGARNRGIGIAKGKFIKFLDADDFLEPGIIEKQVAHFSTLPEEPSVAVYGDVRIVDAESNQLRIRKWPKGFGDKAGIENLIDFAIVTSTPLYKRNDILKVGGFNEKLRSGQEHELNIKLFLSGVIFQYFDEIVFNYREYHSPGRISARNWPLNEPWFMWDLVIHYEALLERAYPEANHSAHIALASNLANAGRALIRAGHIHEARLHFLKAERICPEKKYRIGNRYSVTKCYLAFQKLLGPSVTETVYFTLGQIKRHTVAWLYPRINT